MFMRDNSAAVTAFLIRDARHLKFLQVIGELIQGILSLKKTIPPHSP